MNKKWTRVRMTMNKILKKKILVFIYLKSNLKSKIFVFLKII